MKDMINLAWLWRMIIICGLMLPVGCAEAGLADAGNRQEGKQAAASSGGNKYFKNSLALMEKIENETKPLFPLAVRMPPVKRGEWRYFWNEKEQSPQKYVLSMPSIVTDKLNTLYVQPIGTFNTADKEIFDKTVEFLRINFQTPVKVLPYQSDNFPAKSFRHNKNNDLQLSSVYITDVLLKREMPEDAWGVLAITPDDIYRAEGLDKHYGDSLRFGRRGVISMYYLRSEDKTEELLLNLKGASHEATHLLSLPHCAKYRCNMNGRITLQEFKDAPLHYSPDCLSKVIFSTGADMPRRFRELIEYSRENNLREELDYYMQALKIIDSK